VYEIIKIMPIPIHNSKNVFTLIKTTYHLLAIDKKNRHYLLLNEHDLKECTQDSIKYTETGRRITCKKMHRNTMCEVQIYERHQIKNCEKLHIITNTTFWITLSKQQFWLYSISGETIAIG